MLNMHPSDTAKYVLPAALKLNRCKFSHLNHSPVHKAPVNLNLKGLINLSTEFCSEIKTILGMHVVD